MRYAKVLPLRTSCTLHNWPQSSILDDLKNDRSGRLTPNANESMRRVETIRPGAVGRFQELVLCSIVWSYPIATLQAVTSGSRADLSRNVQ